MYHSNLDYAFDNRLAEFSILFIEQNVVSLSQFTIYLYIYISLSQFFEFLIKCIDYRMIDTM